MVVDHKNFLENPHFSSEHVWRKGNCTIAPNGKTPNSKKWDLILD